MSATHAGKLTDPRVSYAMHHENDGSPARRRQLVASRAARAMREGGRHMDGSPRQGVAERLPDLPAGACECRMPACRSGWPADVPRGLSASEEFVATWRETSGQVPRDRELEAG